MNQPEAPLQTHLKYLAAMLDEETPVDYLTQLLDCTALLDVPFRWHCEMVLAVKENRFADVFHIRNRHVFVGYDSMIADCLMENATRKVQEMTGRSLETACTSSNVSSNRRSVQLPAFLFPILRKHYDEHGGSSPTKGAGCIPIRMASK